MNYQNYHSKLDKIIPQLNEFYDEFLRVCKLDDSHYLVCELDSTSFELDIRLTDTAYESLKLLEGIPPDVLNKYSTYLMGVQSWIERGDLEFPIPIDSDEIKKFVNINTPAEHLQETDAECVDLSRFDI